MNMSKSMPKSMRKEKKLGGKWYFFSGGKRYFFSGGKSDKLGGGKRYKGKRTTTFRGDKNVRRQKPEVNKYSFHYTIGNIKLASSHLISSPVDCKGRESPHRLWSI